MAGRSDQKSSFHEDQSANQKLVDIADVSSELANSCPCHVRGPSLPDYENVLTD